MDRTAPPPWASLASAMTAGHDAERLSLTHEPLKLVASPRDDGALTIGYNHRMRVKAGQICTPLAAEAWLCQDIKWCAGLIRCQFDVQLTQHQFDVLVDFTLSLDLVNLRQTMAGRYLERGEYDQAIVHMCAYRVRGNLTGADLLARRTAWMQTWCTPDQARLPAA